MAPNGAVAVRIRRRWVFRTVSGVFFVSGAKPGARPARPDSPAGRFLHPGVTMRKIQLDLGSLRVESFAVAGPATERGTVQGQAASIPRVCETCCTDVCIC